MKKILFKYIFFALLFISLKSSSQDSPIHIPDTSQAVQPKTKLARAFGKVGGIMKVEVILLELASNIQIEAIIITDFATKIMVKGIRLKGNQISFCTGTSGSTNVSLIDEDDLGGLIDFLNYAKNLNKEVDHTTRYVYNTAGDFQAVADRNAKDKDWTFLLNNNIRCTTGLIIKRKDLQTWIDHLIQAQDLLKSWGEQF